MKPWKLVLGAGAACAACCAAPIISGVAALGIGSGLFAAGAAAISVYTWAWLGVAIVAVALAVVAGLVAWKRKRLPAQPASACGCRGAPGRAPVGAGNTCALPQ